MTKRREELGSWLRTGLKIALPQLQDIMEEIIALDTPNRIFSPTNNSIG